MNQTLTTLKIEGTPFLAVIDYDTRVPRVSLYCKNAKYIDGDRPDLECVFDYQVNEVKAFIHGLQSAVKIAERRTSNANIEESGKAED